MDDDRAFYIFETGFPRPTWVYPNALEHVAEILKRLDFGNQPKLLSAITERVYSIPV